MYSQDMSRSATAPQSAPPAPRYIPRQHTSEPDAIARLLELDAEGYRMATNQRWTWQAVRDAKLREGKQ